MKATAAETGGAFLLFDDSMTQGKTTPLHVHADEDEGLYVLRASSSCISTGPITGSVRGASRCAARCPARVPRDVTDRAGADAADARQRRGLLSRGERAGKCRQRPGGTGRLRTRPGGGGTSRRDAGRRAAAVRGSGSLSAGSAGRRSAIASATASTVRCVLARGIVGRIDASRRTQPVDPLYAAVGVDHGVGCAGRSHAARARRVKQRPRLRGQRVGHGRAAS